MKTNKPKFHPATLEARILSLIEGAFPLMLEKQGGLCEVLTAARGRWEVYKVNYEPRARVRDIHEPYDAGDYLVEFHAGFAFLQIELVH